MADGYLETLKRYSETAQRVTDKLLTNYYFVGIIHSMFPNAKFVHCARNPVDTCFSAYTKLFKDDMPHSYDLGELGRYYRKYDELMAHWHKMLPPGVMRTFVYEDTVKDLEKSARELIDFVGLDWDPACLSFPRIASPGEDGERRPSPFTGLQDIGREVAPLWRLTAAARRRARLRLRSRSWFGLMGAGVQKLLSELDNLR